MDNDANEPGWPREDPEGQREDPEVSDRREFLRSLGKWSAAAIAAILLSESLPANGGGGWINRGGGGWLNSRGGGGSWVNRRGW